jgi:hypothetical protein
MKRGFFIVGCSGVSCGRSRLSQECNDDFKARLSPYAIVNHQAQPPWSWRRGALLIDGSVKTRLLLRRLHLQQPLRLADDRSGAGWFYRSKCRVAKLGALYRSPRLDILHHGRVAVEFSKRRAEKRSAFRHSPRHTPSRAGLSPQCGSGWNVLLHGQLA